MTRDFNNQRREDPEADSRSSSSRRPEEERPSRPARPRLNRDMVDRAWENGARQNHADYRTRSDSNMQSSHGNRRPDQRTNRYSAQNGSNGRKPYANRRENYPPGGRSSYSDTGTRSRRYDSSKRSFDDRSNNQYEHRSYPKQSYRGDHRQGDTQYPRHPHPRSQYQERDQNRGPKQREFDRETPSPRNYDRTQRQARGYEHNTRKQRSQERDIRPSRNGSGPSAHNPRWQNRPERRENNYPNRSREYAQYETEQQLFEGDYEHFDRSNPVQSQNPQTHPGKHPTGERNVTRLPDGRVLKGSSGEQQRGAEFWTEIVRESDDLVKHAETSHSQETAAKHTANPQPASATSRKSKPRTGKTSEPTRGKKPTKVKAKQRSPKPRATGPKPSQRGFKWPTPEE